MLSKMRLEELKAHIIELEEITGGKIRVEPRAAHQDCPLYLHAPDKDIDGLKFFSLGATDIYYEMSSSVHLFNYRLPLYEAAESWWPGLSRLTKAKYNKAINKWLKEREAENARS